MAQRLQQVGTPENPPPCAGDQRFYNPRSRQAVTECITVCRFQCTVRRQCRTLARQLIHLANDDRRVLTGVWHGVAY